MKTVSRPVLTLWSPAQPAISRGDFVESLAPRGNLQAVRELLHSTVTLLARLRG